MIKYNLKMTFIGKLYKEKPGKLLKMNGILCEKCKIDNKYTRL